MDALNRSHALKIRAQRAAATVGLLALASCATTIERTAPLADLTTPIKPNAPTILLLMPDSESAREALVGMNDELGREYNLIPERVSSDLAPAEITTLVARHQPRAIVLMNNLTLRLYRRYRAVATPDQRDIPAVAVLTSFLRETSRGLKNITGIIYEVPLVTSLINLRALLDQPIQRIGIVYRPIFKTFLEEQRRLSSTEGFELVPIEVSGKSEYEVRRALTTLLQRRVDAIWVLNDNRLLNKDMLLDGWLPGLSRSEVPVIVNARSLVSRQVSFGTFAVVPDHRELGAQAAQLITNLADEDWKIETSGQFEYPISVEQVLDLRFARRNLELKEGQLPTVDELVE